MKEECIHRRKRDNTLILERRFVMKK
jgi:hypothetical protein